MDSSENILIEQTVLTEILEELQKIRCLLESQSQNKTQYSPWQGDALRLQEQKLKAVGE